MQIVTFSFLKIFERKKGEQEWVVLLRKRQALEGFNDGVCISQQFQKVSQGKLSLNHIVRTQSRKWVIQLLCFFSSSSASAIPHNHSVSSVDFGAMGVVPDFTT